MVLLPSFVPFYILIIIEKNMQAYFPPISQPEGLPLKIQDGKGKDWVFQFRFWPNNNSRMYVLEGVTPCIQSIQLQAGDTGDLLFPLKANIQIFPFICVDICTLVQLEIKCSLNKQ